MEFDRLDKYDMKPVSDILELKRLRRKELLKMLPIGLTLMIISAAIAFVW